MAIFPSARIVTRSRAQHCELKPQLETGTRYRAQPVIPHQRYSFRIIPSKLEAGADVSQAVTCVTINKTDGNLGAISTSKGEIPPWVVCYCGFWADVGGPRRERLCVVELGAMLAYCLLLIDDCC